MKEAHPHTTMDEALTTIRTYVWDAITQFVKEEMQDRPVPPAELIELLAGLYDWMERHHLEADFVMMNPYIFF